MKNIKKPKVKEIKLTKLNKSLNDMIKKLDKLKKEL